VGCAIDFKKDFCASARVHRYVSIKIAKDLRTHIAAKRQGIFGVPLPLATKFKNARTRQDRANNSGRRAPNKQQTNIKQSCARLFELM
jgi:hypothetical protein